MLSTLILLALLQADPVSCHEVATNDRLACGRRAVEKAEARLAEFDVTDCAEAMTTLEMNACGALDLARAEEQMFRYLGLALERVSRSDQEATGPDPVESARYLEASQLAWAEYANQACLAVYEHWKGGTIRGIMWQGCRIELTRERTHTIWANHLTHMDNSPPVLPEP
ncbi:lysozyme inhibitor LprI family protein [Brevundimonas halotolerans]|uniref:Uncharacterized protein YecT (DUF1311 family) n=1 Tax=Brevundimonas halotolerans TaxID=69670 RepID=A0A7W9A0V6_9CAUL|nr:lysozyme inhibitor LprI family protein [Brevundimonas halotolerans]MBB5659358.1 uncharacterized protein YecT (DUF1311 family) [Brevundimonas halotolerans]